MVLVAAVVTTVNTQKDGKVLTVQIWRISKSIALIKVQLTCYVVAVRISSYFSLELKNINLW